MSELRLRLTLWFLRKFQLFRALERRTEQLAGHSSHVARMPRATAARIEAEVLYTLLLHTPINFACDVLPTQQVSWIGSGEVRVRLFQGGGPR